MDPHYFPSPFPNMVGREPRTIHVLNSYYYTVLQVGASITPQAEEKGQPHSKSPQQLEVPVSASHNVSVGKSKLQSVALSLRTSHFTSVASVSPSVTW